MKNIYKLIAILLITVMLLCSCSTVVETQVQPTPTEEVTPTQTESPVSLPTYITSVEDIGQIIYYFEDDGLGYTLDEFKSSTFRDEENGIITINETLGPRAVEEDVPKKITWNFLGNNLELKYKCSSVLTLNAYIDDVYVDYYVNGLYEVCFLHGTNQPVYMLWMRMDNWPLDLTTYEDYMDVIDSLFGDYVDLEKYKVECTTKYYDKDGISKKTDGFYQVKSNEVIDDYKFNLSLTINGIETANLLKIIFTPVSKSILFFCNNSEYDNEKISQIKQEEIEYARVLTNRFISKYDPDFEILNYPYFSGVDSLNDRTYLVMKIDVRMNDGITVPREFYIDYERLQWKMALEGKT